MLSFSGTSDCTAHSVSRVPMDQDREEITMETSEELPLAPPLPLASS